jgi:hypothetical protein
MAAAEAPRTLSLGRRMMCSNPEFGFCLQYAAPSAAARFACPHAKTVEDQFAEVAEIQPELLARHFTEAL